MGLLSSVSKYYKMSFDKNVLIYVQRPDAGLIATKAGWEKQTGRYLKAGSKGIGVVDMNNPKATLTYYFDLADTRGDYEGFLKAMGAVWSLERQYQPEVLRRFHQRFGTDASSVENCLCQLTGREAEVFLGKYLTQIEVKDENSVLYGLPTGAVQAEFAKLVIDSATYIVFQKCGIKTEIFSEAGAFENISHFGSLELFMGLGAFACAIARPVLSELHKSMEEIKEERSRADEERTVNETGIPDGRGWDALSQPPAIQESGIRPDTGGHFRTKLEGVHEREASHETVRVNRPGKNQRDDHQSGSGGRGKERSTDPKTSGSPAPATDGGYPETGRTYGDADQTGRGDHFPGSGLPAKVIDTKEEAGAAKKKENKEKEESRTEEKSGDSSFLLLPLDDGKELREQEDWEYIQRLLVDTEVYPLEMYARIARLFDEQPDEAKRKEGMREIYLDYGEQSNGDKTRGIVPHKTGADFFFGEEKLVRLSWEVITQEVTTLVEEGAYFSHQEEKEPWGEFLIPDEEEERQREEKEREGNGQLSLFALYPGPYEEPPGGGDQVLAGEQEEEAKVGHRLFPVGSKIAYDGRLNYRYQPEHRLYEGGPKAKVKHNVEAIRLLKQLQQENRIASLKEQIVLARFVGWGGLADALIPGKEGWEKEYAQIEELLTEEELQAAKTSTLTSYYTDQNIIRYIYEALWQFGFRSGNLLDPAMGTGNFFSVLPETMNQSKLYGVELEPIAGEIARKLYPQADIFIKGFEDTQFSDSFFDVVVGNVPFHNIRVSDRRYDRFRFKIHDYFLAKSLDKVRAGGILAVITSKFTLDKENQSVRKYLAQRAELIGAIRLPENAFKRVAGTEVTTDILFLKKREQEIVPNEKNTPWLSVEKDEKGIAYNRYFINHPEMVLGTMVQGTGMYGSHDFVTCKPFGDRELGELLGEAIKRLYGQYGEPKSSLEEDKNTIIREWIPAMPEVKNYSYTKVGGEIYYREDSRMYRQELSRKGAERIEGMIRIRSALRALMDFQLHGDSKMGWELPTMEYETKLRELLEKLNEEYDNYIKDYGYLNVSGNIRAFAKDADAPLLRSIEEEVKDEQGKKIKGEYKKTAVFFHATIRPKSMPKTADSLEEALRITLNVRGKFDLDYLQFLYRKNGRMCSKEEILEELGDRVYRHPAKWQKEDSYSGWVMAEEYLSGQVKEKLARAMLAADTHPEEFSRNVKALKQVQPDPLTPEDISFVLGSTWIPVEVYQKFMYEKFGTKDHLQGAHVHLEFAQYTGTYFITGKGMEKTSVAINQTYGTERINAYEILEQTLNLKTVEVRDRQEYEDPQTGEEKVRYVLNKRETLLAREKQAQLKLEFESWLFAERERGAELTALYNDRLTTFVPEPIMGTI